MTDRTVPLDSIPESQRTAYTEGYCPLLHAPYYSIVRLRAYRFSIQEFILTHGSYLAIIVVLALAGAGLPVPEEIPIITAGVLSSPAAGRLDPWLAFLSCLFGALLGDFVMYWIGRLLGETYMRRHPLFARVMHEEREKQMETLIRNHGIKVFLLARFLVGVRSPIFLAAGVMRMTFRRFAAVDAFCGTIVVGVVFWLSHFFGGRIGLLLREWELALTVVFLLIGMFGAVYYFAWKRWSKRLHLNDPPSESDPQRELQNPSEN